ncbi:MAG: isochorismatase family protein, partial [Pseudomonadota bacterium]
IHHHSLEPDSLFRAELSGAAVQQFAAPQPEEPVYIKHANSAFIGTTLEKDLRDGGIDTVIVCGATGNHCVETTARMAGNLGFNTLYVHDAVWTYAATGPDGHEHSAEEVLSMSLCNLHGEFATVVSTDSVIAQTSR